MFGFAAIFLLSSLFITGENLLTGTMNVSVTLYMAVIPMFVGYLLFGFGLRHLDANKVTLITLLEPVVATLLATAVVGERFLAIGWVGMMLIVGCIVLQVLPNSLSRKSGLLLLKGRWASNQISSSKAIIFNKRTVLSLLSLSQILFYFYLKRHFKTIFKK